MCISFKRIKETKFIKKSMSLSCLKLS